MARLTKEEWIDIKNRWESDERTGFDWLATELDNVVSRQSISKKAKKEQWSKVSQPTKSCATKVKVSQPKEKLGKKAVADNPGKEVAVLEPLAQGRPTSYRPEYDELAYKFCLLGATDARLGELFEVSESTINNWKHQHSSFLESIKGGKAIADARVAQSTYLSAVGGHYVEEEKAISDGQGGQDTIIVRRQIPPDFRAQQFWLKNRQKELWRDRVEVQEEITVAQIPWDELREITRQSVEKAKRKHEEFIEGRYERLGIEKEYQSD